MTEKKFNSLTPEEKLKEDIRFLVDTYRMCFFNLSEINEKELKARIQRFDNWLDVFTTSLKIN